MTRCFDKSTKNWCSVASWVVEVYAWSTIWNFFDHTQPQRPPSERLPYISKKLNFLMIHSINNYHYWLFCCHWWSDHHDQELFWENWALEAVEASGVAEAAKVNEAGEVSRAWKMTSESSRFLNSIIWGPIPLYFDVLKKQIFWQNHENWCWILASFLLEDVEAVWGQKSFK